MISAHSPRNRCVQTNRALFRQEEEEKSLKKISQQMHRSRHNKTHTEFTCMELDSHFVVVVVQGEMLL